MKPFQPCVVIPTRNHVAALSGMLSRICAHRLPVIVIDDASAPETGARIREICAQHEDVEYQRHAFNGGKGFAVMCGIARAGERGFTHAVQIDADGQHDLASLDALLASAKLNPDAIITGVPQYDRSMPSLRRIWRPFTNFWVRVNTLSLHIRDAMCGFRIYPVAATLALVSRSVRSRGMDFDTEILVKAYWAGMAIGSVPVRVIYPQNNFSNFDLLRDNVRLSLLQTRLFFGMLLRAPWLAFHRAPALRSTNADAPQWSQMKERGVYWGLRTLAGIYQLFGHTICRAVMAPVILYFFATGGERRRASRDYLERLWQSGHLSRRPTLWTSYRHFMAFGTAALDKLAAWSGAIAFASLDGVSSGLFDEVSNSGQGAFIITAHLGSPEVIRAVATLGNYKRVNILMHDQHAGLFNRMIREVSPNSPVRAFPVTKIGVDTAIILSQAIADGEWVVIMGDRVPVSQEGRIVEVPFLGGMAAFPQGPFILGALLKAPVYLMFCVRKGRGYKVHFSKFADAIRLPRRERIDAIRSYAAQFAKALEARAAETPLQWFNFYSYWRTPRQSHAMTPSMEKAAE